MSSGNITSKIRKTDKIKFKTSNLSQRLSELKTTKSSALSINDLLSGQGHSTILIIKTGLGKWPISMIFWLQYELKTYRP